MERKTKIYIGILTVGVFTMTASLLSTSINSNEILGLRADQTCIHHVGSHIAENAKFGVKEYYVCCGCHGYWLAGNQPDGTWTEKTLTDEEYQEVVTCNDYRCRIPNYWEVSNPDAKLTWSADGNNVIDASAFTDSDVGISLSSAYVAEHKLENSSQFFVKFKALNSVGSIWAFNAEGNCFGDTIKEGETYSYFSSLNKTIILRGGAIVEELEIKFIDSDVDVPLFAINNLSLEKDDGGFITSMTINTDGVNDFDNLIGFSTAYMKKLSEAGYTKMSFDLARTGGQLTRMHSVDDTGAYVVSYPGNEVVVNINGDNPIHIDACNDGGAVSKTTISLTNIKLYNEENFVKAQAREILAKKFENTSTAWSYIHHGCPNVSVSEDGSTYYLNAPCNFTLTNRFICLIRKAGYRYLQLRVKAYDSSSDTIGQVGFITGDAGGSWETYFSYPTGNEASFCLDLKKWPSKLEDTDEHFVAQFYGRTSGGNNLSCKFEIEILGYYEDGEIINLGSYNPSLLGTYPENSTDDLYVRFKYVDGANWRAPIWGKSSSHIVDGKSFESCTDLSRTSGYGLGWYEFTLPAGTLDSDGELWLCADSAANAVVEISTDPIPTPVKKEYSLNLLIDNYDIVYSNKDYCGLSVANELKEYIYKKTNINHDVVLDNDYSWGKDFISVGQTSILDSISTSFKIDNDRLLKKTIYKSFKSSDSYAICVKDNGIFLFGNSSDSLRYASSKFIENYLGITFLTNEDEFIDKSFQLNNLYESGQVFNPYFDTRIYLNSGAWECNKGTINEKYIDHMGFNSAVVNEFNPEHNHNNIWITGLYKDINGNDINLSSSHNMFDSVYDKGIIKASDHPVSSNIWYIEKGNIIDICYSNGIDVSNDNPRLTSSTSTAAYYVYQNVRKILETFYSSHNHSQEAFLGVGQTDTNLYCTCEQCSSIASNLGRSAITIKFWNAIINKILQESNILKDCNFKLVCSAYQYNLAAPKVKNSCTIPNSDHLFVQIAPLIQDQYLGIGDKAINEIQIDNGRIYDTTVSADKYIKGKDIYPGWKEFGPNLISWNYDSMFGSGYPLYVGGVDRIEDTINVLKKNNVKHSILQGAYTDSSSISQWINAYVYSKLCWDDSERIEIGSLPNKATYYRNDFINKFFGTSNQAIIDAYNSLDLMYNNALKNSQDGLRTWDGVRGASTSKNCGFFNSESFDINTVLNIYNSLESEISFYNDDALLVKKLKRFELTPLMHLAIKSNLFREPFISLCEYLNVTWLGEGVSLSSIQNDSNFWNNF